MTSVLLTRRWVIRHLLISVAVAACIAAGFWQLDRLSERRGRNARFTTQTALPPLELREPPPAAWAFRHVEATGRYDAEREILLRDRSLDGRPGHHALTPLRLAGGSAVLVDRGWMPDWGSPPQPADLRRAITPPAAEVRVTGVLLPPERRSPLSPRIPIQRVTAVPRVDLERIARQLPYRLAPVYVLLASQQPAQSSGLPVPAPPPEVSSGPHLSYAVQWFSFAAIALGGHTILARRALRGQ